MNNKEYLGKRTFTIAIIGDKKRANEVKEIIEMLGGKIGNRTLSFNQPYLAYFVTENNEVGYVHIDFRENEYIKLRIDEFWEKYPFKVGEIVKSAHGNWYTKIIGVREINKRIGYRTEGGGIDNYYANSYDFEKCPQNIINKFDKPYFKYNNDEIIDIITKLEYFKNKHKNNDFAINMYNSVINDIKLTLINK